MAEKQVVIVGAGVAGLSCGLRLQESGIKCRIFEKNHFVGGRVQTQMVEGFQLDRGFQVLLTAYPRAREFVNFKALDLKSFHPGAYVRWRGRFHVVGDPLRRPEDALSSLFAPVGSLADKLRMLNVRNKVTAGSVGALMERPEVTTLERLHEFGFSDKMVNRFFKPFLGGIFLEPNLTTSSRKFEFVFRMFSEGTAALPKHGMEAIPQQLAKALRANVLNLGSTVKSIEPDGVTLLGGEKIPADTVVIATPEHEANRLKASPDKPPQSAVSCLYYSSEASPVNGPWLVLNGEGKGPINNLCVPTEVHASYGPPGKSLISVTVLGAADNEIKLEREVRAQLVAWYGDVASGWQHLRTYIIPDALSLQAPPALEPVRKPVKLSERLFACGDYLSVTSIEGAISSGVRCADEIFGGG